MEGMQQDTPDEEDTDCCVCHDPLANGEAAQATCGHVFCRPCLTNILEGLSGTADSTVCPDCGEPLTVSMLPVGEGRGGDTPSKRKKRSFLDKLNLQRFQSSTKLEVRREGG